MKKLVVMVGIILMIGAVTVWAQEAGGPEDIKALVESTQKTAENLKNRIEQIPDLVAKAKDKEGTEKVFETMTAAVEEVEGSLQDEAEMWAATDRLLQFFGERREETQKKCGETNNQYWCNSTKEWLAKTDKVRGIRDSIIEERARLGALKKMVAEQKDIVVDQLLHGRADAAIAQIEGVHEDLIALNGQLETIAQQATDISATTGQ